MNIKSLLIIKAVAETGSFSSAAKKLNYAQSHISTQIMNLEKEIGSPLFERYNRGIVLTQKGEKLLKYADRMICVLKEMDSELKDEDSDEGEIKIVTTQTSALSLLPRALSEFHREYPKISIKLTTANVMNALSKVNNAESDLAIVAGNFSLKNLNTDEIGTEKLLIVGSDPVDFEDDSKSIPIVAFNTGCVYRKKLEDYLDKNGNVLKNITECDNIAAVISSVCAGLGITLLPEKLLTPYLKDETLLILKSDIEPMTLKLAYRKDYPKTKAIERLIAIIKREYRKK